MIKSILLKKQLFIAFFCSFLNIFLFCPLGSANDLYVGSNESDETLTLSSNTNSYNNVYVGFTTSTSSPVSSNNTLIVENDGTELLLSGQLFDGYNGNSNQVIVSNGGSISQTNLGAFIGYQQGSDNNEVIVTGSNSSWDVVGNIHVGYAGSSNRLTVSDGGAIYSTVFGIIGFQSNFSSNNSAIVTNGSSWSSGEILVGYNQNTGNNLTIVDNSQLLSEAGIIGWGKGASNNEVTLSNNSLWSNSGQLTLGRDGSSNSFTSSNSSLISGSFIVGDERNASNNRLILSSNKSGASSPTWINSNSIIIGNAGSSNSVALNDNASLSCNGMTLGFLEGASNNRLVFSNNASCTNSGRLVVGSFGSSNQLDLTVTSTVVANQIVIGSNTISSNNRVTVSDGALLRSINSVVLGNNGIGNSLSITNGGKADLNGSFFIAYGGSSNNAFYYADSNSSITGVSNFYVGYNGSSNLFLQSNGASLSTTSLVVGNSDISFGNQYKIDGANTFLTNASGMTIGSFGYSNQLVAINGAKIYNGSFTMGANFHGSNNSTYIGSNSVLSNSGITTIGNIAGGNILTVDQGKLQCNLDLILGSTTSASNNTVIVEGTDAEFFVSNSSNTANIFVGKSSPGNTLTVSNVSSTVPTQNLYVGFGPTANSNNLNLYGSTVDVNNNFILGYQGSGSRVLADNSTINDKVGYIGYYGNNTNLFILTNSSVWSNSGALYIGYYAPSNSLEVSSGNSLYASELYVGYQSQSSNNQLYLNSGSVFYISNEGSITIGANTGANQNRWIIDNADVQVTSTVRIGSNSSDNILIVSNGGTLNIENSDSSNNDLFIGDETNANGNSVIVTDDDSSLITHHDIYIGNKSTNNSLYVSNGATLTQNGSITCVGTDSKSSNNLLKVTGNGTLFSSEATTYVGSNSSSNSLILSDGAQFLQTGNIILADTANSANNLLQVSDSNTQITNTGKIEIGKNGSNNQLIISGGAVMYQNNGDDTYDIYIGGDDNNAKDNSCYVSDTNSLLETRHILYIGYQGNNNILYVSNGGRVKVSNHLILGAVSNANNNTLKVEDSDSDVEIDENLYIGINDGNTDGSGIRNEVDVTNGGLLTDKNVYIGGSCGSSHSNRLVVSGDNAVQSNSSCLFLGGYDNEVQINNGGTLYVKNNSYQNDTWSSGNPPPSDVNSNCNGDNDCPSSDVDLDAFSLRNLPVYDTFFDNQSRISVCDPGSEYVVGHDIFGGAGSIKVANSGKVEAERLFLGFKDAFDPAGAVDGELLIGDEEENKAGGIVNIPEIYLLDNSSRIVASQKDIFIINSDIAGKGEFFQKGKGMTILNGENSFEGSTVVLNGVLALNNPNALMNSPITVGGTPQFACLSIGTDVQVTSLHLKEGAFLDYQGRASTLTANTITLDDPSQSVYLTGLPHDGERHSLLALSDPYDDRLKNYRYVALDDQYDARESRLSQGVAFKDQSDAFFYQDGVLYYQSPPAQENNFPVNVRENGFARSDVGEDFEADRNL